MLFEIKKFIPFLFCCAILILSLTAGLRAQNQELLDKIEESATIIEEITDIAENGIPPAMMKKAGGVVLIPDMYKGGFIVGGRRGKGIALIQNEDGSWSRPVFVTLTGGSFGLQIGVQKIELILVFKDAESLRDIGKSDFTLGGDISVAAGPVGRQSSAATNFTFDSAVYSYSKTKGVFAGLSLDGTLMEVDSKSNRKFYEADEISAQDIFEMESSSDELLNRLHRALDNTKKAE
ncbi:MAG TPA: lipid-binding SYLF domain-containing protein [Balneolaceae bacterium]|nr:lipid-binding SYLF domain-containing protein [Balneolaceae bacterium]